MKKLAIFDFDGTGMLEIEKIDEENVFTDDEGISYNSVIYKN